MATVSNTITLNDRMSPVLRSIVRALDSTSAAIAGVDRVNSNAFNNMRNDISAASAALNSLGSDINQLPNSTQNVERGFSSWQAAIVTANQALNLVRSTVTGIGNALYGVSNITDLQSRLVSMTDEQYDIYKLQEMIARSADATRSSYAATASAAMTMHSTLKGMGLNQAQSIRLADILNKHLGANAVKGAQAESVMYNLAQSLRSGRLQWEDWREIQSNAGGMNEDIAAAAGMSVGEFNQAIEDGKVSAADFARYLAMTGDKIDEVFDKMPDTFADQMQRLNTFATKEFLKKGGLHDVIKNLLANDTWQTGMDNIRNIIRNGLNWASKQVGKFAKALESPGIQQLGHSLMNLGLIMRTVLDGIVSVSIFIMNYWGLIQPIVWSLVIGFTTFNTVLAITNMLSKAQALWAGIVAIRHALLAYSTGVITQATFQAAIAQHGLNAAMWAFPVTWIVAAIFLVIAALYFAVAVVNHFAGTSVSATGIIAGTFMTLGAIIYNLVAQLWNVFATFAEYLVNVFRHPIYSIKALFINLATAFLDATIAMTRGWDGFATSLANAFATAMNFVISGWNKMVDMLPDGVKATLGIGKAGTVAKTTSITSDLSAVRSGLQGLLGDKPEGYVSVPRMDYTNIGGAWDTGYNWGSNLTENIPKFLPDAVDMTEMEKLAGDQAAATDGILDALNGKGGGVPTKVKGDVEISDEDLKLLKDVAQIEWINKFTTLTPNLNVKFGDVRETADTKKIVQALENILVEAYTSSLA